MQVERTSTQHRVLHGKKQWIAERHRAVNEVPEGYEVSEAITPYKSANPLDQAMNTGCWVLVSGERVSNA